MFPSLMQEAIVLSGLAARFPKSRWFGRLDRTWADPASAAPVDWVPGAFALVRRDLFDQLGGFDERFFLYYEEVDLCRRIHAAGYRVQYWPELRVQHIGGVSARTVAGATVARSGSQLTLWRARSGLLYYRKNHGWLTAWAVNRLERGWHALRGWRAALRGQTDKAVESATHRGLLQRAWRDTLGGRVAPPRPW
jgi:N-acetylglucosaminyl-diphospho-decaprenol L-rhamnosyltransferase